MANDTFRTDLLDRAERALDLAGRADAALLSLLGGALRVACAPGDDESLEARADRLIERASASLPGLTRSPLSLDTAAIDAWLSDVARPCGAALDALDRLGALSAGMSIAGSFDADARAARAAIERVTSQIAAAAEARAPSMLHAAIAASERIAERGVAPGHDDALIALSDVLGERLSRALSGEQLEAPSAPRLAVIDLATAQQLSMLLGKALARPSLDVSPDMLDLPRGPFASASHGDDLVLHNAAPRDEASPKPITLLRDVHVTYAGAELWVDLDDGDASQVLLVPLRSGEPGSPCPARAGARASQRVFSLDDDADGYALVIGERLAFLRRR